MRLAKQPSWLVGLGFSAAAFGLHAAALHQGSLSLVQPIVVSAIVFAVFIRSALDRRPRRKEVWWAIGTWAGLTLLITGMPAGAARHAADEAAAQIFVAVGVGTAAIAVAWAHKTRTPARRGLFLGAAAGVSFGLIAGLLKIFIAQAQGGFPAVLEHWSLWAFEGFRLASYLRSIVLAAVTSSPFLLHAPRGVIVLAGTVCAVERLATEGWKAILREQDQTRYTIPMRFAFRGRTVDHRRTRYLVCVATPSRLSPLYSA